jgi:hypothetical protein
VVFTQTKRGFQQRPFFILPENEKHSFSSFGNYVFILPEGRPTFRLLFPEVKKNGRPVSRVLYS